MGVFMLWNTSGFQLFCDGVINLCAKRTCFGAYLLGMGQKLTVSSYCINFFVLGVYICRQLQPIPP